MLIHHGLVVLEFAELVNADCLSKPAYDKAVQQGRITVAQKGGHGHPALIDWDSLADKYKELVRHHLGGCPTQLAKAQAIEQHLVLRPEDERFIDDFKASNGYMLSAEKRAALKKSVRVLAFLAELAEMPQSEIRSRFGSSVMQLKATILDYVKANKVDLPHSFPRLEARKRDYLENRKQGLPGAAGLVHAGYGNANSKRVVDPVQLGLLETIASRHQNYGFAQIASQYNAVAKHERWPSLTPNTVAAYLKKGASGRTTTLWAKGRAAYQQSYGLVVKRTRPTRPTLLWVHDATDYELYYRKEVGGKTTYHHRKTVMVVMDPHSWYPVGYAIGEADGIELSKLAVKNAVEHMAELFGSYVLPYQMQSDRLGHKALGRWYDEMGVTYTPAAARNARAKAIEPWFKHHHQQFVQPFCANWSGHNITASPKNQPNPDALERIKHTFPDEAGVIAQIHANIARERVAKVEAYVSALRGMDEAAVKTITRARFLELFGTVHPWSNQLTNRGLCPTIMGEERVYNMQHLEFQEWVNADFQLTYDPADLSTLLATTRQGTVRFLLEEEMPVPMALADHTPETRARLARKQAFKLELSQGAIDRRASNIDHTREVAARLLDRVLNEAEPFASKEVEVIDLGLAISAEEEAVTRGYFLQDGSHKAALASVKPKTHTPKGKDDDDDVERRAIAML